MGFNGVPATDPRKLEVAFQTGRLVMEVLREERLPRLIITRKSLQNAIAGVMATGGSTNAVLHLLAVAREAGVALDIDEFDRISRKTPLLADLRPWGHYTAPEMYEAGGMGVVARRLLDAKGLKAGAMTVTGRTIGDEARATRETPGQKVIRPLSDPVATQGGLAILRGNLAPDGCVAKLAGHDQLVFRGRARVQPRGGCVPRRERRQGQGGGLRCDPLRGTEGWSRYARDASRDGRTAGGQTGQGRQTAKTSLHVGSDGEVRAAGVVGVGRQRYGMSLRRPTTATRSAHPAGLDKRDGGRLRPNSLPHRRRHQMRGRRTRCRCDHRVGHR